MKFYPFLCLGGVEIAFADRIQDYVRNGIIDPRWSAANKYNCDILREGDVYVDPATDNAPWYDSNYPASEEFFGISPSRIDVLNAYSRSTTNTVNGGVIGPLTGKPRIVQFTGVLIAKSERGMMWGERWLNDVLAGRLCPPGQARDEALLLPVCPEDDDTQDPEFYLRRLIDVGIVDGPLIQPQGNLPECLISQITFQLAAGQPYLFSPPIPILEDEPIGSPTCALITTTDSPGDAVAVITITATSDVTGIRIEGKPTFSPDGVTPPDCPHDDGMPTYVLEIPSLPLEGVLTIDSARREIRYRSPTLKEDRSGLSKVSFDGPLNWPEVFPCSDYCLCITAESGSATVSIDKIIREW